MAYSPTYIIDAQIRDSLVVPFRTAATVYWDSILTEADQEMIDMAQTYGIESADISIPVHNTIQNYLVAYFTCTVLQEKMGNNDIDGLEDKYEHKLKTMWSIRNQLRKSITAPMIKGTVEDASDRAIRSITRFRT